MRVLSRLFRRRFLEALEQAHGAGRLRFFGEQAGLADRRTFHRWMAPLRRCEWVVYAKRPFAGPEAVLAYLSHYTHRVAISNSRLVGMHGRDVTFRWKDYRDQGPTRHKTMTLDADEFMRRLLLNVLPGGFHRIRHYGFLANGGCQIHLAQVRALLGQTPEPRAESPIPAQAPGPRPGNQAGVEPEARPDPTPRFLCPHCAGPMRIVEVLFEDSPFEHPLGSARRHERATHPEPPPALTRASPVCRSFGWALGATV